MSSSASSAPAPAAPNPAPPNETPFWTDADQMSLTAAARTRLAGEGLATIADFIDFKEEQLNLAFKNMRTTIPAQQGIAEVVDSSGNVTFPAIPAVPAQPGLLLSAKCIHRLKVATKAYHYYVSIGRSHTMQNMHYVQVKSFYIEYEALEKLAKKDKPDVPLITKNTTPLRWIESFHNCCYNTFGVRDAPIAYVIRDDEEVPDEALDLLLAGKLFGNSGSIIDEMIKRMNHTDPLFKTDNATVYSMLEKASRGTIYRKRILFRQSSPCYVFVPFRDGL